MNGTDIIPVLDPNFLREGGPAGLTKVWVKNYFLTTRFHCVKSLFFEENAFVLKNKIK